MKKLLLLVAILCSISLTAQNIGIVKGTLTDKEANNEPLPFANVLIKGTQNGTTTDFDGNYTVKVKPGTYTIVFSFLGYKSVEKTFTITAGQTITINQAMSAEEGVSLDEVKITTTTTKEKSSALLLEQKKATIIKESIGAEDLSKKGVGNAAVAITKISGVSKQEGSSNVYVRGLGDRYQNTTMNGLSLPSNNANKKNLDLSLFKSDVIQNISISKAYSAEFYSDFAAGNVDITSKEFRGNSLFNVNVSTGFNTRAIGKSFLKSEGTGHVGFYRRYQRNPFSKSRNPFAVVLSHGINPEAGSEPIDLSIGISGGKSFDFENDMRLSLYGTLSFNNGYEYREGPVVDYTTVFKTNFPNSQEFEYSTSTTALAHALLKIDSDNELKYTTMFLNNSSDVAGFYGTQGGGQQRDAILDTDRGFYQTNIQFNQDMVFVNQLTGKHKFYAAGEDDPEFELDWGVGYNTVFAHEPDRRRFSLENYQYSLDNDPNTNASFFSNTVFDNQRYFQNIYDEELNSRLNLKYNVSENLFFNFGYNGRYKTRDFDNIRYGYDFLGLTEVPDPNNLDAILTLQNLGSVYNIEVFNALPGLPSTNVPGRNENEYSGKMQIHAGYVSAVYNASEKFSIVPGIRFESFQQEISYDVININPNDPKFRSATETFVLPSLNLKYALNDQQNLRFTFSKTVSVPEFKEVAPFVYEGVNQRLGGNPDLIGDVSFSEIFNFDLKYEWFINRGEVFSVSTFAKQINNPVNLVIANDATGTQRYFRTGDRARVLGFELEARKNIINTSDDETILSAGFNFSYMHTEQDLKGSTGLFTTTFDRTEEQLQGASPYLINANLTYTPVNFEKFKPTMTLVFAYFADRIDALGSGQLGNIVEKSVPTLDFIWRNDIGENMELNFSAMNILDPRIRRVRETAQFGEIDITNFRRGSNVSLGFTYKF
ncbi:MAG: TonB-dependent receptor [Flavobacteriaceae bacterium]|nr:TonB-dependent receptor [Flavobacteriaceae bacterium]|tara:strand:- start:267734 stop:270544 length:2811 start_codon:yes stop_codon:yes gene_type:complete